MKDQVELIKTVGRNKYFTLLTRDADDRYRWRAWNLKGVKGSRWRDLISNPKFDPTKYIVGDNYDIGFPTIEEAEAARDRYFDLMKET